MCSFLFLITYLFVNNAGDKCFLYRRYPPDKYKDWNLRIFRKEVCIIQLFPVGSLDGIMKSAAMTVLPHGQSCSCSFAYLIPGIFHPDSFPPSSKYDKKGISIHLLTDIASLCHSTNILMINARTSFLPNAPIA